MTVSWLNNLSSRFPRLETAKASAINLSRALITTSLLVSGGVMGMRYLGLIEAAELAAYDQLVQLHPAAEPDDRLLIVGVTENDLQTLQEWPVSDRTIAQAIAQLAKHQPHAIAVDIFRDFPNEPGTADLQAQVQQTPNVLMICKTSAENDPGTPPPPWANPEQVAFADVVVDSGGILRRSLLMAGTYEPATPFPRPHLCNQPGQSLLSLSFKAALMYLSEQGIEPGFNADQQLTLGSTVVPPIDANIGGYQGVDAAGYQVMLYYRSEDHAVPEVSLMEVINGEVDAAMIRDRIVFIGYTTPQAKDEFYTPYSSGKDDQQKMPGVLVHAQSTSQLLSTVLDGRPLIWTWPTATEILWIFVWSVTGGILAWYLRHPAIFALIILIGCVTLYGLAFLVFLHGGWIPLVPPALTFIGTAVGIVSLDRFNHSPYGQQVYRKVKNFLRLDIDIDDDKVEQQVSEITESDYFRDLQETVQTIRATPEVAASPRDENWPHEHQAQPWEHHPIAADAFSYHLDSLLHPDTQASASTARSPQADEQDGEHTSAPNSQVVNRGRTALPFPPQISELTSPLEDGAAVSAPSNLPSSPSNGGATTEDDYELSFLQDIAQEAARLQQFTQSKGIPTNTPQPFQVKTRNGSSPTFLPFELELTYCRYTDRCPSTQEYLNHLTQAVAVLRSQL